MGGRALVPACPATLAVHKSLLRQGVRLRACVVGTGPIGPGTLPCGAVRNSFISVGRARGKRIAFTRSPSGARLCHPCARAANTTSASHRAHRLAARARTSGRLAHTPAHPSLRAQACALTCAAS